MDQTLQKMTKAFEETQTNMQTQTEIRDKSMKLRVAMLDEFGREIYLDLP